MVPIRGRLFAVSYYAKKADQNTFAPHSCKLTIGREISLQGVNRRDSNDTNICVNRYYRFTVTVI